MTPEYNDCCTKSTTSFVQKNHNGICSLGPMRPLKERLKQAMELRGMNQSAVAKAASMPQHPISQQNVQHLLSGRQETSKHLPAIAKALHVRLEWLTTEDGPMEPVNGADSDLGAPNAVPAPIGSSELYVRDLPQNLPVMGSASCGDDGLFEFNRGEAISHVRRPPRLLGVRGAYAVHVSGDSMSPRWETGDLVYVNPHQPPRIGDYVVVQLKPTSDGENPQAYIKRLAGRTGSAIKLQQFNPAKEIAIKTERVLSVHRIIDWQELMAF